MAWPASFNGLGAVLGLNDVIEAHLLQRVGDDPPHGQGVFHKQYFSAIHCTHNHISYAMPML
jgi:hypothetical protein